MLLRVFSQTCLAYGGFLASKVLKYKYFLVICLGGIFCAFLICCFWLLTVDAFLLSFNSNLLLI